MTDRDYYFERILKSSRTFLSRWRGADGVMWELTVSIKHLRLVLTRPGQPGNLLVACIDPVRLRGPVRWQDADLTVSRVVLPDGEDEGFLVTDEKADLEVMCGKVEIAENVKLY